MRRDSDFLVLGSGVAGLCFALRVAGHGRVAVVTKKEANDSNTSCAQGGIAAALGPDDSVEAHVADTLRAGAGLCHEPVVRFVATRGPQAIAALVEAGIAFDRQGANAGFDLGLEGGHSRRRVLHVADMTGRAVEKALLERSRAHGRVEIHSHHLALDLVVAESGRILGARVLEPVSGRVDFFAAPVVLLATGGCCRIFRSTTNPEIATGDGIAMAWRAGARVANMEFIQFHPTCLAGPGSPPLLISEAVRGEGAVLRNRAGDAFMRRHHPQADLAPRDVVARAIDLEMRRSGTDAVLLDCTALDPAFVRRRFPHIHAHCLALGFDMTRVPLPVVPAAHYSCGGVLTDLHGETDIANLFAAGEVACTGLHGANRLASNSLVEAVVFADAAAGAALARAGAGLEPVPGGAEPSSRRAGAGEAGHRTHSADDFQSEAWVRAARDEVRDLMARQVGIVRTLERLRRAADRLRSLSACLAERVGESPPTIAATELRNMVEVAGLIVRSALTRRESRGLHFLSDLPDTDAAQAFDTVLAPPRGCALPVSSGILGRERRRKR